MTAGNGDNASIDGRLPIKVGGQELPVHGQDANHGLDATLSAGGVARKRLGT